MSLEELNDQELDELINRLTGHGGYSPLLYSQCMLCKLKDEARAILRERRGE